MYRLEVTKDYLGFAAAHFVTSKGDCERLHGHNYQAWFEVEGELSDDGYVFDVSDLQHIGKELCDALDHRVLLATENPKLQLQRDDQSVSVTYANRRYTFPERDVALLPISNTTAELLATYLAIQLAQRLRSRSDHVIRAVGVWISEGPGQRAFFRELL